MDGVLVVDKPQGPTSHDIVTAVRRLTGIKRIGHTGTLDPLATGVLPLVVGRATRLASLLAGTVKGYLADVRFGAATATYDADSRFATDPDSGRFVMIEPPPPEPEGLSRERVQDALLEFSGTHSQVPPAYSAKKIAGLRAYARARRNEPVAPRPVDVTVYTIALEDYASGLARIRLLCSAGFYVRTFAHDLGQRLGCGAHLEGLRRTRAGDFTLDDAVGLERLDREGVVGRLVPLERLLPDLPAVILDDDGVRRASHGNTVGPADRRGGSERLHANQVRLLDRGGALLGIARTGENGLLHPVIVLV
jgi:tRNA pseudouridine55 synthase